MNLLYIFIVTLLIFDVIVSKKSSFSLILACLIALLLFSFTRGIYDQPAYLEYYEQISMNNIIFINGSSSSFLFALTNLIGKIFLLNFDLFRLALMTTVFFVVKKVFADKINLIVLMLFYLTTLFIFDCIQIRYFMSTLFLILGINFLMYKKNFMFLLMLLISIFFHSINLIFIILFLVAVENKFSNIIRKSIFLLGGFCILIFWINENTLISIMNCMKIVPFLKEYLNYLTIKVNNGFVIYVVYFLINFSMAIYMDSKLSKIDTPIWTRKFNVFNYNIQVISILFVILTMIDINFSRYFRVFLLISIINFSSYFKIMYSNTSQYAVTKNCIKDFLIFGISICIWCISETIFNTAFGNVLNQLLSYFSSWYYMIGIILIVIILYYYILDFKIKNSDDEEKEKLK